jgi:hypothetical protein
MRIHELINEEWSKKYKNSINCSHPKGFSQKAHCAGKKKHNESMMTMEAVCPDCGMCQTHGNLNEIKKGQKDSNGFTKCWPGKHAVGTKKGKNGGRVRNCVPNESQGVAEGSISDLLNKDPTSPKFNDHSAPRKTKHSGSTPTPYEQGRLDAHRKKSYNNIHNSEQDAEDYKTGYRHVKSRQGVAEGLEDTQKKIEDTINKLEDRLKHAKTDEQWDNIKNRIERLQAGLKRSKQGVAEGATKIHSDKEPKLTGVSFQQLDSLCESAGSDYVKFDRAIKKNLALPAWTNTLELYGVYARKLNEVKSKTLAEGTRSDIEQQLFDRLSQRALDSMDSASVGDRVSLLHLATLNIPGHKVVAKLNGFLTPKQIVKIVNTGRVQQLEFADGSRYPEKDGGDIFQQTQTWNMTKLFPSADAASKAFMFYVLEGQKLSDVLDFQTNVEQGVAEGSLELEEQFDIIESMIEYWAEQHNVDSDVIWEDLESVDDEELLSEAEAWQTSKGKNKNGGLNKKGVASYRKSHPGSHLQTAVTTKPSKLKKGSKASKRRKSFCARMKGMKKHRTGAKTKHDPNSRINKSLRKWHCE